MERLGGDPVPTHTLRCMNPSKRGKPVETRSRKVTGNICYVVRFAMSAVSGRVKR
jgi:hypothetical protein